MRIQSIHISSLSETFPQDNYVAAYATLSGYPTVCGGGWIADLNSNCYSYKESVGWELVANLGEDKAFAAALELDDGTVFVTGKQAYIKE